jgi:multiple sugar transport system permease protein
MVIELQEKFKPKSLFRAKTREAIAGYLFVSPALIGFLILIAGPIIGSFFLSLTDFDMINSPKFAGIANYDEMLNDPLFWQSLKVISVSAFIGLPLNLILSLALAVLLNNKIKGISVWRTVYYLPTVVAPASVAVLWVWILNPEYGVVNGALRWFGIEGPYWLGDSRTALGSLIVVNLWGIGANVMIYLAGLQGIPVEMYEAGSVDGANGWRSFRYITLPLLTPIIFFTLVLGLIYSWQWFTEPYVMTQGGPENSTLTYLLYSYRNAFVYFKMGYALALVWVMFAIVLVLTILVFRSSSHWVFYENEVEN